MAGQEIRELKIDQFLTQQYGWGPDKTLRAIFLERGLKEILRDFYDYLERDK